MSDQANAPSSTDPTNRDASAKPVWLVEHPTHQYEEDVKALARQHGLQVVDPAVAGPEDLARSEGERPSLTLRDKGGKAGKGSKTPTKAA